MAVRANEVYREKTLGDVALRLDAILGTAKTYHIITVLDQPDRKSNAQESGDFLAAALKRDNNPYLCHAACASCAFLEIAFDSSTALHSVSYDACHPRRIRKHSVSEIGCRHSQTFLLA